MLYIHTFSLNKSSVTFVCKTVMPKFQSESCFDVNNIKNAFVMLKFSKKYIENCIFLVIE